jgi:hypothetical protein
MYVLYMSRTCSRRLPLISLMLILASFGCGGPSASQSGQDPAASGAGTVPELTEETIRDRINGARVRGITEENGSGEPISWTFYESEPKELTVVDKQVNGARATVVLDIKTGSGPNSRNPRLVFGQFRTEWELETGWVLRRWEIVRTENISMKYRNLAKPPDNQNSNQNSNQNQNADQNQGSNQNRPPNR